MGTLIIPIPDDMKAWIQAQAAADERSMASWVRLTFARMMRGEGLGSPRLPLAHNIENNAPVAMAEGMDGIPFDGEQINPDDLVANALASAVDQGFIQPEHQPETMPTQGVRSLRRPASLLALGNHQNIEKFLGR